MRARMRPLQLRARGGAVSLSNGGVVRAQQSGTCAPPCWRVCGVWGVGCGVWSDSGACEQDQACASQDCWRRGHVAPCETGMCFAGSRKAVTAGITVVSTGEGSAVCTVVCMGTQDECKTNSVVYISPAHCGYVQVLPTQTEVVEFPPPYQYLPKLVFPYPTQWNAYPGAKPQGLTDTTITICNWSGHNYWFSTGDSTDEVRCAVRRVEMRSVQMCCEKCSRWPLACSWSAPSPTLSPTDPVPRGLLTLCPGASSGPPSPTLSPTDPVQAHKL